MSDVMRADKVVAHNISFDRDVISREMRKRDIPPFTFERAIRSKGFCTMYKSKNLCDMKNKNGNLKVPKLSELHNFLFGCEPTGCLHDALYDCEVTLVCYKGLKKYTI
jgi:DNA polymerase III epsilon subunit-like protein